MKLKTFLSILAFHLILQHPIFGQSYLGIKFGLVRSNLLFKPNYYTDFQPQFKSGLMGSIGFRTYLNKRCSVEFDMQYTSMGYKVRDYRIQNNPSGGVVQTVSGPDDFIVTSLNYISIPVSLFFDIYHTEKSGINLHSGFAPGLFFSGSVKARGLSWEFNPEIDFSSISFFWQSGIGFHFLPSEKIAIRADLNYTLGSPPIQYYRFGLDYFYNQALFLNFGISRKL
jgi:hypothetical protein